MARRRSIAIIGMRKKANHAPSLASPIFPRRPSSGISQTALRRKKAEILYAVQQPTAASLFAERTTMAAWRSKPSWYAVSKRDETISPDLERFLATRMKATTVEVNAGHLSLVSARKRSPT